jgi:site-specific recombinase XerD
VVFKRLTRADARGDAPARAPLGGSAMTTPASFAPLLERFFTQRLMQQRQASPHTISSYRDTFRQFLKFTQQRLHKPPSRMNFEEIVSSGLKGVRYQQNKGNHVSEKRSAGRRYENSIVGFYIYSAFSEPASAPRF